MSLNKKNNVIQKRAQYTALLNNVYKLEKPKNICPRPNKNCTIWCVISNTLRNAAGLYSVAQPGII